MFKKIAKTAVYSLPLMATAVLAHPGDHEHLSAPQQTTHFMSDPWHVGIALAVVVIAVAIGRRWLLGESR